MGNAPQGWDGICGAWAWAGGGIGWWRESPVWAVPLGGSARSSRGSKGSRGREGGKGGGRGLLRAQQEEQAQALEELEELELEEAMRQSLNKPLTLNSPGLMHRHSYRLLLPPLQQQRVRGGADAEEEEEEEEAAAAEAALPGESWRPYASSSAAHSLGRQLLLPLGSMPGFFASVQLSAASGLPSSVHVVKGLCSCEAEEEEEEEEGLQAAAEQQGGGEDSEASEAQGSLQCRVLRQQQQQQQQQQQEEEAQGSAAGARAGRAADLPAGSGCSGSSAALLQPADRRFFWRFSVRCLAASQQQQQQSDEQAGEASQPLPGFSCRIRSGQEVLVWPELELGLPEEGK
jgi:hypothetical protein